MARLPRGQRHRLTGRESEATESVKEIGKEVWKFPTPSSPSPGNHVRIGDEVAVPKVGVLRFGAVEAR